jgi:hypothetical protein
MKGDTTGARGDFVVIAATLDAPESARQRANAAVGLIDSGSAKLVAGAVKAAIAAPPPMLAGPGGLPLGLEPPAEGSPQQ